MTDFDAWADSTLFPFAKAILAEEDEEIHISWSSTAPGQPRPIEPKWRLAENGFVRAQVPFGTALPAVLHRSAHAALVVHQLGPAVWAGLDAHLADFDAGLEHSGMSYILMVFPIPSGLDVRLIARPLPVGTTTRVRFQRRDQWPVAHRQIQDHIQEHRAHQGRNRNPSPV